MVTYLKFIFYHLFDNQYLIYLYYHFGVIVPAQLYDRSLCVVNNYRNLYVCVYMMFGVFISPFVSAKQSFVHRQSVLFQARLHRDDAYFRVMLGVCNNCSLSFL